jgi:hypothetical protein
VSRTASRVLFAFALLTAGWCWAGDQDQILFVHLRLNNSSARLVECAVKSGRLKPPAPSERKGTIYLQLLSTNGLALWSEVLNDPCVRRVESHDPSHPEGWKTEQIKTAEADFVVRIPFFKEAAQIKIERLDKPARAPEAASLTTGKQLLGYLTLQTTAAVE